MAQMSIGEDGLKGEPLILLPTSETKLVNNIQTQVAIEYVGCITMAEEKQPKDTSKPAYLKVTISILDPLSGAYVNIDDFLTYNKRFVFRLNSVIELLGLNKKALNTEDFFNKYIVVTIKHDEWKTPKGENVKSNKIDRYLRLPTNEEFAKLSHVGQSGDVGGEDPPF